MLASSFLEALAESTRKLIQPGLDKAVLLFGEEGKGTTLQLKISHDLKYGHGPHGGVRPLSGHQVIDQQMLHLRRDKTPLRRGREEALGPQEVLKDEI
eukprot:5395122-Alexandrium_andersonii.AAC.1